MVGGQEETSTNQVGCKRGTPWDTPTTRNLVTAMSVEELRSFSQVLANISLELSDGTTASTKGGVDNAFYFSQEKFAAGLCFPIPSTSCTLSSERL